MRYKQDPNQASPDRLPDPTTNSLNIFYRNYRLVRNACQLNDGNKTRKREEREEEDVYLTKAHIDVMIEVLKSQLVVV